MFDDLTAFLHWWLSTRPINTPHHSVLNYNGTLNGVVLYRQDCYQVQLFIVQPDSVIDPHTHPNVDSYEVHVGGDIEFMCDDVWYKHVNYGDFIRVKPSSWHGGKFGPAGGCFLSVQKWLNGVKPTTVGDDWSDEQGNTIGSARVATSKD